MKVLVLGNPISAIDLLVYVGIVCRLFIFYTWNSLHLVYYRKLVTNNFYEYFCLARSHLRHNFIVFLKEVKRLLREGSVYLFDTDDLTITMDELQRRFVSCGEVDPSSRRLGRMHLDRGCVVVTDGAPHTNYTVNSRVSECYSCSYSQSWTGSVSSLFTKQSKSDPNGISAFNSFQVNTRYKTYLEIFQNDSSNITCRTEYHFAQYGVYNLSLDNCQITVQEKSSNAYIPLFWGLVIICLLAGARLTYQAIYKTSVFRRFLVWLSLRTEVQNDLTQFADTSALLEPTEEVSKRSRRLRSLDAFRGLSISIMIFVNYGGGSYYFFNHSPWNGLTVADLVFPWFIWIMGVSLVISIQSQLRNSIPRIRIIRKIFKRSLLLILLGLILNSDGGKNDLRSLRIPGVLQRFGLSYLLVAVPEAVLTPREFTNEADRGSLGFMLDLTSAGCQWFLTFFVGGLHTAITLLMPVPDCPKGYLGPGGLAEGGQYFNCTGGAAMWVDVSIFGKDHIYQTPTCRQIYSGNTPHDPEGLLGTLNSVALVWLGVAAGRILLVHQSWQGRVKRWLAFAMVTGLAAGCLCGFSKNEGFIPVNKNLWSLSFILSTASFAFILLSAMYLLIDVFKFWSGSPLHFAGMNSILLYMGHEMVSGMLPWSWKPFTESHAEQLAMNMWGAGLWVATSYALYKNKFFLAL